MMKFLRGWDARYLMGQGTQCRSGLPRESCYIIDCIKRVSSQLGVLNDVIIIGGVAKCLAGLKCCGDVGDVDIFIKGSAVNKFWEFIRGLFECEPDETNGFRFQPVYDLHPQIINSLGIPWNPCQREYYAHPLALTINCRRHLEGYKRVNLDIVVTRDEVTRILYHEFFLYLLDRGGSINNGEMVRKSHEEFMNKLPTTIGISGV
ncbi:hypothetical protein [Vulcanisaeta souniana]|uniref:hypothetical protein n=1 Tax=Vulcanisaeta souniana TaxID=164452 RepID=UPI001FB1D851|nr:hypothetical protein [Vulcanisaeta souniana]